MRGKNETWGVYPPKKYQSSYTLPTIIAIYWLDGKEAGDPEKEGEGPGWYVGNGTPGCLYDNISGPFKTKKSALEWARQLRDEIKNPGY